MSRGTNIIKLAASMPADTKFEFIVNEERRLERERIHGAVVAGVSLTSAAFIGTALGTAMAVLQDPVVVQRLLDASANFFSGSTVTGTAALVAATFGAVASTGASFGLGIDEAMRSIKAGKELDDLRQERALMSLHDYQAKAVMDAEEQSESSMLVERGLGKA